MNDIKLAHRMSKVKYAIRDIADAAEKVKKEGKKLISLNIGDPNHYDFVPPTHITEAIIEAVKSQKFSAYAPSAGDPELRKVIADREDVPVENTLVTHGLSEGIDFVMQALVDPGDNVLLPSPCYPLYWTKTEVLDGEPRFYKANPYPDPDELRKLIDKKTKFILLINPNNPTGAVYPEKTIKDICNVAGEHGIPIMADEVYDKLVFDKQFTPIPKIAKDVPVIRGYSVSKVYFYPGARVGYLSFHGDWKTDVCGAVQKIANTRLCINWEMQRGAIAAFKGDDSYLKENMNKLRERRDYAHKRIQNIDRLEATLPDAAFYMFIKIKDKTAKEDSAFVLDMLRKTGVVTVPGSGFSPNLQDAYFRIVYLPPIGVLEEAFNAMETMR